MNTLLARLNGSTAARRLLWLVASVLLVALSVVLMHTSERRQVQGHDLAVRSAWRAAPSPPAAGVPPPASPDAVIAKFAIRAEAGNASTHGGASNGAAALAWQVASAAELCASLAALSAGGVGLARVHVTRNAGGFAVSAERSP
ncbi:MAG: hypothetical protein JNL19_10515 [Burkholderiales bacterium]|nr:hypothetical protein [Burkholderiales bacterium]